MWMRMLPVARRVNYEAWTPGAQVGGGRNVCVPTYAPSPTCKVHRKEDINM